jgi:hypothetical protein
MESGKPMPLFAPAELVDSMRVKWPRMWIEPMPTALSLTGRAITHADWVRVLEESSKSD